MKREKELVVGPIIDWANKNGWHLFVVNSSAVFNPILGIYLSSQAPIGCSDMLGTTPQGNSAYIEAKAPGKLNTLKEHQRDFLVRGISIGAFAVVVDSLDSLVNYHLTWLNHNNQKAYLITLLPKIKKVRPPNLIPAW